MALLFNSLTAIDEAFEDEYFYSAFEQALNAPANPDSLFDGITTYYDHFEDANGLRVTRDTGILAEFVDDTDNYSIGIVRDWVQATPSIEHATGEWAYIETEQGGRTYAAIENIVPICEVQEHVENQHPLQSLQNAFADTGQTVRVNSNTHLFKSVLQFIAAWVA